MYALIGMLSVCACKRPYRVGEHIWVDNDAGVFPAFVREKRGGTRLLVHYQGCDDGWMREVTLDRVKGRVAKDTAMSPEKFACVKDAASKGDKAAALDTPFKAGDKVRVKWRGSVYSAVVVRVEAPDRFRIHYEGHETVWDETVAIDRIVGRR